MIKGKKDWEEIDDKNARANKGRKPFLQTSTANDEIKELLIYKSMKKQSRETRKRKSYRAKRLLAEVFETLLTQESYKTARNAPLTNAKAEHDKQTGQKMLQPLT